MIEINVVGHRDSGDLLRVLSVERQGVTQWVESTGRRWVEESGEHILVMLYGGEVLHLVYKDEADCWYLVPRGEPSMRAI